MKRLTTTNIKTLLSALAIGLASGQAMGADLLDLPLNVPAKPEAIKGELYGPEISGCQDISGGWKGSVPDFQGYALREMSDAAKDLNKVIDQKAPNLARFLNGASLAQFIDFRSGKIREGYTTFAGPIGQVKSEYILTPEFSASISPEVKQNQCGPGFNALTVDGSCFSAEDLQVIPSKSQFIEEQEVRSFLKNYEQIVNNYRKKLNNIVKRVSKCSALYSVVYNANQVRGMDFSDYNKSQEEKSFDGKLKCTSLGYETQDFKACAESAKYYDGVFLGRKAVETAQSFQYMDSSMDIQTEFAQNAQTDATAGLKAQKQDIQKKADMARTRAATETAAVAALYTAMKKLPTLDELVTECEAKLSRFSDSKEMQNFKESYHDYYNKTVNGKLGLSSASETEAPMDPTVVINGQLSTACQKYVGDIQNSDHALIQNAEARDIIQQALIDSGMNIATMMGTAEILDKQAGRVGDAIKLVDGHEPETLEYNNEDLLATECQVNPGSENCVNAQYERGVGYHNDGISVNGMQFATSDSTLPIEETSRNTDAAGDNTNRTNTVGGIGATINPVDKGSGLADSPLGAASVSSTGANGIGAGAGGGGAGGGGASAPANGSARTGGAGGSKPYVGSSKKVKYSGGSGLSFSSGSSRRAKKAKAANPFSSLFGKKSAKKNGVLNFRGVASGVGKKNGSIFQMISKRYSAVNKDNRLLEYQKVNK